ncbi:hypothetical protein [Streptomyces rubrogriseus]|uniref:hypothetical protein n=1 Tax=Streptomyces rubrogriseus TaxID=194673 RepID=UPI00365B7E08
MEPGPPVTVRYRLTPDGTALMPLLTELAGGRPGTFRARRPPGAGGVVGQSPPGSTRGPTGLRGPV